MLGVPVRGWPACLPGWLGGWVSIQGGVDADSQNEGRVEDPSAHSMLSVIECLSVVVSLSLYLHIYLSLSPAPCQTLSLSYSGFLFFSLLPPLIEVTAWLSW